LRSKRLLSIVLCIASLLSALLFTLHAKAVGEDEFVLDFSVNPENSGSFRVEIDGVEAMESTELAVKKGASVTVEAIPGEGYAFDHWVFTPPLPEITEQQRREAKLSFAMPEKNVSAEAYFSVSNDQYTVTIEENDGGMGNFGHKDFEPGKNVTVEAWGNEGYRFVCWEDLNGGLKGVELPEDWEKQISFSFSMPEKNVILAPQFEPNTYYVTLKIVGNGEARIADKEKNSAGKYEVVMGEVLELSALPGTDHVFVGWSVTNEASLVDYDQKEAAVVCPASDFELTATFASSIRSLTVKASEGGTVRPVPGVMNVGVGNVVPLTATPNEGYAFSHWECSSANGSFESFEDSDTNFTMPDEDCSVSAVFVKGGYRLTVTQTEGGEAKAKEGVYEMGDKVSLEAVALDGYVFSYWKCTVNGAVSDPKKAKTEIIIPGEDVKVTAVFVLKNVPTPVVTQTDQKKDDGFPWGILIVIFVVSAVVITLVILREQLNLSYRYLLGKSFESLKNKRKKK